MNTKPLFQRDSQIDEQALAALHDEYYPTVFRYVRYRLEDIHLVEDISAEVFLRYLDFLYRKAGKVRDVRAWLIGTASNLVNDHLRRKYRRPVESLEEHLDIPVFETPEHAVEKNDSWKTLRQAVGKLTGDQQQVLALRFGLEYSLEETAHIMHKTVGAVKLLQFRAVVALRKLLEGLEER